MFPVADDRLPILKIADYWAGDFVANDPPLRERREVEIRDQLVGAWWEGSLVCIGSCTRLRVLRFLFQSLDPEISFVIENTKPPKYIHRPDIKFGWRALIPVPSADPTAWSEETCNQAFSVLAVRWRRFRGDKDADPAIGYTETTLGYRAYSWEIEDLQILRKDFFAWLMSKQFHPPQFWGEYAENLLPSTNFAKSSGRGKVAAIGDLSHHPKPNSPTARDKNLMHANARGRRPEKRAEVIKAMAEDIASGSLSKEELSGMKQEALASRYNVSRETAQNARKEFLKHD